MKTCRSDLFGVVTGTKRYRPVLTASLNRKGVLDVDTVKGCSIGMAKYVNGCYGDCYAAKTARMYGIDYSVSVSRKPIPGRLLRVLTAVAKHTASWYRVGVAGDPSHDWENTTTVCELLQYAKKTPVIVTKHWITATDEQLQRLAAVDAVFNTSTSGMDTGAEIEHRATQINRIADLGMRSINRVVTCRFGNSRWAKDCSEKQEFLLAFQRVIDTPFRTTAKHLRVQSGDIILTRRSDSVGGGSHMVSVWNDGVYLGTCADCPDQCGVTRIN